MKNLYFLCLLLALATLHACNITINQEVDEPQVTTGISSTGPEAVIYQTKGDYRLLVPVILNADKTEIVSYPAPKDIRYKGKLALPTVLENGFLLDNRGINEHVAFINITYEEYFSLEKTPDVDELMALIVDYDPLVSLYSCGKRAMYNDEVNELNAFILNNDFSTFEKVK